MGETLENTEDLNGLVRTHGAWVYAAAMRRVRNAAMAEDVTQAVFILLWRKRPSFSTEGKMVAWIARAIRYCAANALKLKQIRDRHEREVAIGRPDEFPSGEAQWGEIAGELEAAMDRLRENDRQAVLLRFYRGMSLAEVGDALGVNADAARMRVDRAVERLRARLASRGLRVTSAGLSAAVVADVTPELSGTVMHQILAGIAKAGVEGTVARVIADLSGQMMVWARVKVMAFAATLVIVAGGVVIAVGEVQSRSATAPVAAAQGPAQPITTRPAAPAEAGLLRKLQEMRAATIAAVPAGRGTAILETKVARGLAASNQSVSPHEVQFLFSGPDAMVRGGAAFNETAVLVKDGRRIRYYAGSPAHPAPAAVSIQRQEPILYDPYLPAWSFRELAALPFALLVRYGADEVVLFPRLAEMTGVSVSQEGTIIQLLVQVPPSGSRLLVEFDERYGGMISHYRYDSRRVRSGGEIDDVSEEWQMQWAAKDRRIIPVRRATQMEVIRNGKVYQREQSDITFKTFLVEDVRPEELTIGNMGIAAGTRVLDSVEHKDWTYGQIGGGR